MSDFQERSQLESWGLHDHMHYINGQLVEDTPTVPVPESVQMALPSEVSFSPLDVLAGSRTAFYNRIQQQIEGQEEYPVDPIWQEDHMIEQLDGLLEREVITDEEHAAIFAGWITKRRPDTSVIRVAPKPRGYGRGYHNE